MYPVVYEFKSLLFESQKTALILNPWFNLLKPSGFFTYHQVSGSKILQGALLALSVLYGTQNKQRPLLYTSLTGFYNRGRKCLQRGTDWVFK